MHSAISETSNRQSKGEICIAEKADISRSSSSQPCGKGCIVFPEEHERLMGKKVKKRQWPMTDFTLITADGFEPFITHQPHKPVPIALVNRAPHGSEYIECSLWSADKG
jgi:hypothetical protein